MFVQALFCSFCQFNGAGSHITPSSKENNISVEPCMNLKQKVFFPLPARTKPQHANGLREQSGSLSVRSHWRCRSDAHSSYNNSITSGASDTPYSTGRIYIILEVRTGEKIVFGCFFNSNTVCPLLTMFLLVSETINLSQLHRQDYV